MCCAAEVGLRDTWTERCPEYPMREPSLSVVSKLKQSFDRGDPLILILSDKCQ